VEGKQTKGPNSLARGGVEAVPVATFV